MGFGVNAANSHTIEVGTNLTNGSGAYLSNTGNWLNVSDQNKKEDFTKINGSELLNKTAPSRLPVGNIKEAMNTILAPWHRIFMHCLI